MAKEGTIIRNVTPTNLYKISDEYNLIVIEDNEGELHNLVFSNAEILKARAKGLKHSHKVPEYRLNLLDCTEIFIVSTLVSLAVGILTGYFLW